jgi:hypothetical protein
MLAPYATWAPAVGGMMRGVSRDLAVKKIPFIVAYQPVADESSWLEAGWSSDVVFPIAPSWSQSLAGVDVNIRRMFAAAGVSYDDYAPAFWAYENRPDRLPLFGTEDGHFSRAGNALMGQLIASKLEKQRPWEAKH